jgi:CDP-diacylglycerol--serine O-phosphatidyltransferase
VPHDYVVPVMLGAAVVAALLFSAPWPTLAAIGIAYLFSIPFTLRSYRRMRREAEAEALEPPTPLAEPRQAGPVAH